MTQIGCISVVSYYRRIVIMYSVKLYIHPLVVYVVYISQLRVPSFNPILIVNHLSSLYELKNTSIDLKLFFKVAWWRSMMGYIGLYTECNIMWTTTRHVYNMREMTSQRIRLQSTIPVNKTSWWLELSEPLGGPKGDPFKILFYILLRGTTHMAMPQSRFTVMTRGIKRSRHRLPNGIESISIDAYGSTPHVEPMYRRPELMPISCWRGCAKRFIDNQASGSRISTRSSTLSISLHRWRLSFDTTVSV